MSLRWRLTLYYGAISAVLLFVGGLALFLVLRSSLHQTLDDSLREAARVAASQVGAEEVKTSEAADTFLTRLPGATVLLVYGANGKLTDQFGIPPVKAPLQAGFLTLEETRVYTERIAGGGYVQAMRSVVETGHSIGQTGRLLLLGLPLLLLLGLGAGYALADRALRPVDSVTRLAGAIAESGRYRERVPEASGRDEMARLTQTFNAMLGRLEATIERERAFALAAAHELRTPLSVLQGRASLSLERERTPEQYREALQMVYTTSRELAGTVESLLMLARSNQTLAPQAVGLDLLAVEVCEGLQELAQKRAMRVRLEPEEAPTCGDPLALRASISNLVSNALKYGQAGGRVWVRTRRDSSHSILEVADDGPGIPDNEIHRLLQPFQRGSGTQGTAGAGLGLALAHAIAQGHGGRLVLTKAPEGGLLARLELPAERK